MAEYTLIELIDRIGLEYDARDNSYCPFCPSPDMSRRNLHFKFETDQWRCNKCGSKGRVLHFFSQYVLGETLPESKTGRRVVSRKLNEYMGGSSSSASPKKETKKRKEVIEIPPAPDQQLHAVYTAMAEIPILRLTSSHKKQLLGRGLTEDVILRNQYRTIPEEPVVPDHYVKMYEKEGGDKLKKQLKLKQPAQNIHLGLMIAHTLTSMGHSLKGVPGFFKFGSQWCFWAIPGILIPTRNMHGQIVIWQVRKKYGEPKYLTLHKTELPEAVTSSVSRCHFPLGNAACTDPNVPLLFTEGPLKADVAVHLFGSPVAFAAIPGINTKEDLLRNLAIQHKLGRTSVVNCFDMDRHTNPNVRQGTTILIEKISELGITVKEMNWGSQYAKQKLMAFSVIAKLYKIHVPQSTTDSVYNRLDAFTDAFQKAGIKPCVRIRNGKEEKFFWDPETKGIDDFLFLKRSQETE